MQNTRLPFPGATGTWPEPSDWGEFGISVFPAHCSLTIIQSLWGPEGFFGCPVLDLACTFALCNWKFLGQKVCLHMAWAITATNLVKLKTGNIQASNSFLLNLRSLSQTTEVLELSMISSCAYVNSPPPA